MEVDLTRLDLIHRYQTQVAQVCGPIMLRLPILLIVELAQHIQ